MYKNIIISVLAVSVITFAYIAIRNSTPIKCDHIIRAGKTDMLCVIELGNVKEDEVYEALRIRYTNQPYNFK